MSWANGRSSCLAGLAGGGRSRRVSGEWAYAVLLSASAAARAAGSAHVGGRERLHDSELAVLVEHDNRGSSWSREIPGVLDETEGGHWQQSLILNIISPLAMVRIGTTFVTLMVDVVCYEL